MANITKYTVRITLDTSHDTSYRFNSEREMKEALTNRIERACKEAEKYFDIGSSAKLSRTLADYYNQQLSNLPSSQRNTYSSRNLKDGLELILMKYYYKNSCYKLLSRADIDYNYGKYSYNIYNIMQYLQSELDEKLTGLCNDAYDYIITKYTIKNDVSPSDRNYGQS